MPTKPKPGPRLTIDLLKPKPQHRGPVKPKGGGNKPKSTNYTVRRGDTLSSIARKNGTTLAAIFRLNPKFKSDSKYAGGNKIFSGTKVRLR